jgi:hypothetical protein
VTVLRDSLEESTREPEDLDLVHDVLSNRRRRQILRLLEADPDQSATVPELASTIAAWEMDIDDPEAVSYDDRKSLQSTIYQHHAPKMAAAELVEFDKRSGRLELDTDEDALSDDESSTTAGPLWREPAAATAGTVASIVSVAATGTIAGPGMALVVLGCCVTSAFVTWKHSDP